MDNLTLVNVLILVVLLAVISWVEFALQRRPKADLLKLETYSKDYLKYLTGWARRNIWGLGLSVLVLLLWGPWLAGITPLLLRLFLKVIRTVTRPFNRDTSLRDAKQWLASLGTSHSQRAEAIDQLFEERTATLQATYRATAYAYATIFTASRSLAGMSNREQEYLRIAELLNSAANGTQEAYRNWRAVILWGNGKGSLRKFYSFAKEDSREALSRHQFTVDFAVNEINEHLAHLRGLPGLHPEYRAIVEKSAEHLVSGGGSWLKSTQLASTPFVPSSDFAVHIGSFPDGAPLTYSGDGSMVTIAPPGSGKTQCHVFPNLLSWQGPAVVLDVSGDIYEHTAAWRAKNVGPVYKFSPLEPESSHSYNPLTFVRSQPDYIWEDSRLLAEMMIVPSLTSDPFWENEARTVLTAAIAYVCYSNPPQQRPMHAVLDVLFGGKPWDQMILSLRMAIDVHVMMQHATSLSSMNEKTLSSVLQTARSSLGAWSGERVARATARSDWSPLDLRNGSNPTVYIYIRPNEVDAYLSLLRVFIGQHIRMLTGGPVPSREAPPILFMLDELPRLRYMPPVDEALNIGRKYGLRLWMFAQSVGQFKTAYENADGMLSSCAARIFMNPSGADGMAERLSDELGYVDSLNDGTRKHLVEAAELTGPAFRDYQIAIGVGARPAKLSKDFAFADPELKRRMALGELAGSEAR